MTSVTAALAATRSAMVAASTVAPKAVAMAADHAPRAAVTAIEMEAVAVAVVVDAVDVAKARAKVAPSVNALMPMANQSAWTPELRHQQWKAARAATKAHATSNAQSVVPATSVATARDVAANATTAQNATKRAPTCATKRVPKPLPMPARTMLLKLMPKPHAVKHEKDAVDAAAVAANAMTVAHAPKMAAATQQRNAHQRPLTLQASNTQRPIPRQQRLKLTAMVRLLPHGTTMASPGKSVRATATVVNVGHALSALNGQTSRTRRTRRTKVMKRQLCKRKPPWPRRLQHQPHQQRQRQRPHPL